MALALWVEQQMPSGLDSRALVLEGRLAQCGFTKLLGGFDAVG